jgi:RNA polymerase sigma factor (TIGR02999 family)
VPPGEITVIMERIQRGEEQAADRLLPLVYDELRRLAAARMAREAPGVTLQPTALVHEAWIRLGADQQPDWQNRAQFFSAAAEAMRRILIDAARKRLAERRGGRQEGVALEEIELATGLEDSRAVAVNDALERFAMEEPQKAELVKLRFFVGMELRESAQALGVSEATAVRWWNYARAWLIQEVGNWKPPP